jgi:hypothetical protein
MPGIASQDQLMAAIAAGQTWRTDWNKNFNPTTAATAGEWHALTRGGGNPPADALFNTGTNLTIQQVYDTTTNAASILHNGNVGPTYYKQLVNATAYSAAATTMPAVAMLIDLIAFYRITSVTTTTAQSLTNTLSNFATFTADASTDVLTSTSGSTNTSFCNLLQYTRVRLTTTTTLPAGLATATDYYVIKLTDTTIKLATSYANAVAGTAINITDAGTGTHTLQTVLPRYTNGAGVQAMMWNTNATAMGAATPNLSLPSYTNSAQSTGRATPTVLPVGKTAAANTLVLYSGTGAGKYGPFVPLQAGDAGIAQADQVQISVSYVSGEFSVALCKPLLTLPMTTIGVASERDLVNQIPSMPRIYDGAALYWLLYSGAATPTNSAFYGHLDFVWS